MTPVRGIALLLGVLILMGGLFLGFETPLVVSCGTNCTATVGNLVGYVTNASSALGIVGATVKLLVSGSLKYSTLTTTAGYYKFSAITSGGYVENVTAAGYQAFQGTTGVAPGTTATYSVALSPLSSSQTGSGSGCTPTPTGGCTVPPPPPGTTPPPPPPGGGNSTNTTTNGPIAITLTCSPSGGGGQVACYSNATGGKAPYSYAYTFGDGATGQGATVRHTYVLNGRYVISSTAKDAANNTVTTVISIQVSGFGPAAVGLTLLGLSLMTVGAWPTKGTRGGARG